MARQHSSEDRRQCRCRHGNQRVSSHNSPSSAIVPVGCQYYIRICMRQAATHLQLWNRVAASCRAHISEAEGCTLVAASQRHPSQLDGHD